MPLSFDLYAETYPRQADVQIQEGYNLGIYPKMFSTDFIFRQPEMSGWIQVAMQQNTIVLYVITQFPFTYQTHLNLQLFN